MMLVGLAIMIISQAATLAGIEPCASWNTPICWTGFILFADATVYRARGDSWIRSAPREFAALAIVSIPLWLVFEGFNLVLRNWYYTGLPENFALRQFGYAWSFATIWPALFEGAELVAVLRARIAGPIVTARGETLPASASSAVPATPAQPAWSVTAGLAMLASPVLVPASTAPYLAAPVWLGFILLLDPVNRRLGAETLTWERVVNLSLSGLLCGVMWEFWNYWARAKWHYSVPILEQFKLFEMPLPGYLGFPAFALECFTMYVFLRRIVSRDGRTIAL